MKSRCIFLLITLITICSTQAYADIENWYAYWGLGFSNTTYPEPLDSALNAAEAVPGSTRVQLNLDILGFYFPVNGDTIAGFVINSSADRLENGSDNIQLNLYTYGASAMKFFGTEPGDGFFLRGDFGITKAVLTSNLFSGNIGSDTGTGFLIGAGYGFVISPQHRILLNFNYANRTIESNSYKTSSVSVGILF